MVGVRESFQTLADASPGGDLMLLLLASKPLQVEVSLPGFPWIEVLGPLAVVIAAFLGARFAAKFAADRLGVETRAASDRHAQELGHDRDLRDREAVRAMLDEVGVFAAAAMRQLEDYDVLIETTDAERRDAPSGDDVVVSRIIRMHEQVGDVRTKALAAGIRLKLRFEKDDPVAATYERLQAALRKWGDAIATGDVKARTDEEVRASEATGKECGIQFEAFTKACRSWVTSTEGPGFVRAQPAESARVDPVPSSG